MYNATNAATWLWAPQRLATRLRVLRRASIQLNDLFVNLSPPHGSTRLGSTWHFMAQRNSTQRFVFYNASPRGSASHRAPRLPAAHRASIQLNDLFVTPRRNVAYSIAALFYSTQRFVYQFIAAPRNVPPCSTALRLSTQLNDLFVNLLSRLDTALGNEPRRNSACRDAQQLNATN